MFVPSLADLVQWLCIQQVLELWSNITQNNSLEQATTLVKFLLKHHTSLSWFSLFRWSDSSVDKIDKGEGQNVSKQSQQELKIEYSSSD